MSRRPLALVALLATLSCTLALGCSDPSRLRLEGSGGFDPVRWDAGPVPAGELGVERVRFSITPFYTAERQRRMLDRMASYLEKRLELPVEADVSASYLDAVEKLERGELEVAQLSPYACVQAQERIADLELLATAIAQGTTTYASYLVVRHDSDIEKIEDAKGRKVAFTDRWSTSGFLYPWSWLREQKLDPARDFDAAFYGTHDRALAALLNSEVELAAVSSDTLVSSAVLGVSGPVRVLAKAGRIPYDCVVTRKHLSPALRHRIREAFLRLSIHTRAGRDVLRDYNLINGFMPVSETHYDDVRQLAARVAEHEPSELPIAAVATTKAPDDDGNNAALRQPPNPRVAPKPKPKAEAKPKPKPAAAPAPSPTESP
jgi:phosphonate transport system substrate-binding protein